MEKCEVGKRLGPSEVKASTTQVVFTNSVTKITCTSSSLTSKTKVESAEPLTAEIAAAPLYGGCTTAGGAGCTIKAVNAPYSTPIAWREANTATLTLNNGGSGEPGINVECGFLIRCVFSGNIPYDFVGGGGAKLEVIAFKFTKLAGASCPAVAEITTVYGVTAPNPVYPAHT